MTNSDPRVAALEKVFDGCATAAVACSGGVDSMTLAFLAHRAMGARVTVFHAQSLLTQFGIMSLRHDFNRAEFHARNCGLGI